MLAFLGEMDNRYDGGSRTGPTSYCWVGLLCCLLEAHLAYLFGMYRHISMESFLNYCNGDSQIDYIYTYFCATRASA
jgi:hypothetical protein